MTKFSKPPKPNQQQNIAFPLTPPWRDDELLKKFTPKIHNANAIQVSKTNSNELKFLEPETGLAFSYRFTEAMMNVFGNGNSEDVNSKRGAFHHPLFSEVVVKEDGNGDENENSTFDIILVLRCPELKCVCVCVCGVCVCV